MPATSAPTPSSSSSRPATRSSSSTPSPTPSPSVVGRLEALTGQPLDVRSFDLTDHDKTEHLFAARAHRRGHPLRRVQGGRRERGQAAGVLREQPRLDLLAGARDAPARRVDKLVFSSSATVYGADAPVPMTEDLPTSATNPYGWTKVMQEQILRDVAAADPHWRIAPAALLQPGRRAPVRHDRRGPVRHPQQPDAVHRPGRRRPAREAVDLRRRLPHPRRHRRARLHPRRRPRRRARRRAEPAHHAPTSRSRRGTSAPATAPRCSSCCTRSSGPAATSCPTRSSPGAPATSPPRTPTRPRAEAELGWRATRTVDDMCADTWRWQSRNPHGYPEG